MLLLKKASPFRFGDSDGYIVGTSGYWRPPYHSSPETFGWDSWDPRYAGMWRNQTLGGQSSHWLAGKTSVCRDNADGHVFGWRLELHRNIDEKRTLQRDSGALEKLASLLKSNFIEGALSVMVLLSFQSFWSSDSLFQRSLRTFSFPSWNWITSVVIWVNQSCYWSSLSFRSRNCASIRYNLLAMRRRAAKFWCFTE